MRFQKPNHHYSSLLSFLLVIRFHSPPYAHGGEAELEALMNKMSSDVLELAVEIERVYEDRCTNETLHQCANANYDVCTSEFPNQTCPGGDVFTIPACGDGVSCSGLFDFTVSSVELPDTINKGVDGNPINDEVKETICHSLQAEPYMIQKFQNDTQYWSQYNVSSPPMFFGSINGAFRIYPARQKPSCGQYDPTKRPWYAAATSGPKDVILVLDTSGSMKKYDRLTLAKEAASTILKGLTVGDHVSVVSFDTNATYLVQSTMMQATEENKRIIVNETNRMEAKGQTNFMEAFDKAFDVLEQSRANEFSSNCHTAILFLTDGKMTVPSSGGGGGGGANETDVNVDDVIELIAKRKQEINVDPHIFLYGLGYEAKRDGADADLQKIACSTGGIYSHVEDGGDLSTAMANYYKLMAPGLGDEQNESFVAWVDPYRFATGNVMGTTVSAPVYDRSMSPPVLIGAVGIDFTMAAMDKALGVEAGSSKTLDRLVRQSIAICPKLSLTECEIQSLRNAAGGEEALCPDQCTDFVGIVPEACGSSSDYPTSFWENTGNEERTYVERTCCEVGETRLEGQYTLEELQSMQCISENNAMGKNSDVESSSTGIIVGIVLALVAGVGGFFGYKKYQESQSSPSSPSETIEDGGGGGQAAYPSQEHAEKIDYTDKTDVELPYFQDIKPVIAEDIVPMPVLMPNQVSTSDNPYPYDYGNPPPNGNPYPYQYPNTSAPPANNGQYPYDYQNHPGANGSHPYNHSNYE